MPSCPTPKTMHQHSWISSSSSSSHAPISPTEPTVCWLSELGFESRPWPICVLDSIYPQLLLVQLSSPRPCQISDLSTESSLVCIPCPPRKSRSHVQTRPWVGRDLPTESLCDLECWTDASKTPEYSHCTDLTVQCSGLDTDQHRLVQHT